jgi:hypothetical protein
MSRKTIYHSLEYCRRLLQTPVPPDFLKEVKPGRLSIALVPERFLLLRDIELPGYLNRYMHIILLDNPLYIFKSFLLFLRRYFARLLIRIKFGFARS